MSSANTPNHTSRRAVAKLGNYRLFEELPGGPLTRAFVASDAQGARLLVRALYPELALNESTRHEFIHGHTLMQRLRHPHTVTVVDVVNHPSTPYVVMQLMSGGTAQDQVDRNGPLHPISTAQIGLQLCSALAGMHGANLLHLGVKPDNVFMGIGGSPRLGSPGIPAQVMALTAVSPERSGLGYSAPEALQGTGSLDPRADVLSLGATLYTLVKGETLVRPGDAQTERLELDGIPDALRTVIARCCSANLENRFASVAQVESALRYAVKNLTDLYGSEPPRLSRPSTPRPAPTSMAPPSVAPPSPPPPAKAPPPLSSGGPDLGIPLSDIAELPTRIKGVPGRDVAAPSGEVEAQWEPSVGAPASVLPGQGSRTAPVHAARPEVAPSTFPPDHLRSKRPRTGVSPPPPYLLAAAGLVIALMLAMMLLITGSTMLMRIAEHEVDITRRHLYTALGQEDARISDWISSEFEDGVLMASYSTWRETYDEPARIRQAISFVDAAEARGNELATHVSAQRYRHTERILRDLLEAKTAHEEAVWLWHARGSSALGRIAVRLGTAREPR